MKIAIENKRDTSAGEFFDLVFGGVTIYGCQYKSGTGRIGAYEFIATPQRKGTDRDGNAKWYSIVKLDNDTAKAALDAYKGDNPQYVEPPFQDDDIAF